MSETNIDIRETNIVGRMTRELIVHQRHCAPLAHYGILMTGISDTDGEFRFYRLNPGMVQVLACLTGAGEALVDGEWRVCDTGQAYVTPSGRAHAYRALPGTAWRVCWVQYNPSLAENGIVASNSPILVEGQFGNLAESIESLYREATGPSDPGILFNLSSLVHAYVLRSLKPRTRLAPLWDAVRADLAHEWTIAEMADYAHVSGEHLRRLCEQEVGESPMRHLTMLRMREAAVLLSSVSYKIHDIAQRVGYENVFAFSTAFKRCFGRPPSRYRTLEDGG